MLRFLCAVLVAATFWSCDTWDPDPAEDLDPTLLRGSWEWAETTECTVDGACTTVREGHTEQLDISASEFTQRMNGRLALIGPYSTTDTDLYLLKDGQQLWIGDYSVTRSTLILDQTDAQGPIKRYRRRS